MAKTRGTGLLMLWCDVDPEHEAEFNRWYDEERVEHLLSVPGILNGGRYIAVKGGPKYLVMYELEAVSVLRTPALLEAVRGGHVGRNAILNAYRQLWPARTNPIELTMEMPRFMQMGRIDIPAHMEEEFNEWYNEAYIPGYLAVPGVIRARRFAVVDGQPKYLTVYEFEHEKVSESEAWRAHQFGHPWTRRVRRAMRLDEGSPGVYKRIYPAL